ncbi:MAG TPA: hypothetical protein VN665_01140, partial [Candidatus Paceibacterota bacterium]|nr:hypothetical protein [Candidatus Paceibacterota bacterium]
KVLSIAEEPDLGPGVYRERIIQLFPDMQIQMVEDLLPLVVGNAVHIKKLRQEAKPVLELDHRESTIAVGRGFDWLHLANEALIVGPFSIQWLEEVTVAANIVLANLKREPELAANGATLLVTAPHRGPGVDAAVAKKKAIKMARDSWQHIKATVPELFNFDVDVIVGAIDRNTMQMRWLEDEEVQLPL